MGTGSRRALIFVVFCTRTRAGAGSSITCVGVVSVGASIGLIPFACGGVSAISRNDGAKDGVIRAGAVEDHVTRGAGIEGAEVFEATGSELRSNGEGFVGDDLDCAAGLSFDDDAGIDRDILVGR